MKDEIYRRVRNALAPDHVEVLDDSDRHAGHAGSSGGGHYEVTVVSGSFEGLGLVARQRLVYALFDAELKSGEIHAMALQTRTPAEWAKK